MQKEHNRLEKSIGTITTNNCAVELIKIISITIITTIPMDFFLFIFSCYLKTF